MTILLLVALLGVLSATTYSASTKKMGPNLSSQVTGRISDTITGTTSPFVGTFIVTHFMNQTGELLAVGSLTGDIVKISTGEVTTIAQEVNWSVANFDPSSNDLHFTFAPQEIKVLSLVLDLDPLNFTISGKPGTLIGGQLFSLKNSYDQWKAGDLNQIVLVLNKIVTSFRS